ncbi:MAG: bifunctional riboflavin kinase/FAD synthetase [Bacteriovoracia bacterium]
MRIFRGISEFTPDGAHSIVTIGNFDGFHLGHRQIVQTALSRARALGLTSIAYTFKPHPQIALRPEKNIRLLTTYAEKLDLLAATGLDCVIEEPFSREFSSLDAATFFRDYLIRRLQAKAIVVGYDFGFGRDRQGQKEQLEKLCRDNGVELTVVPPFRPAVDGGAEGAVVVSSSQIRSLIVQGNVPEANRLLGYDYFYRGTVTRGDSRGNRLGFPTANFRIEEKVSLPFGVYATITRVLNGERAGTYGSVTNIGVRPTFNPGAGRPEDGVVETHLLADPVDTQIDLYGRKIEVAFLARLRDEKKFDGVESLKRQIEADVVEAKKIHALQKP